MTQSNLRVWASFRLKKCCLCSVDVICSRKLASHFIIEAGEKLSAMAVALNTLSLDIAMAYALVYRLMRFDTIRWWVPFQLNSYLNCFVSGPDQHTLSLVYWSRASLQLFGRRGLGECIELVWQRVKSLFFCNLRVPSPGWMGGASCEQNGAVF